MSEPDLSPLPTCERCRKEAPCVRVVTAQGERTICVATCHPAFVVMRLELQRRIAALLENEDADFFDTPTRRDIPTIPPKDGR